MDLEQEIRNHEGLSKAPAGACCFIETYVTRRHEEHEDTMTEQLRGSAVTGAVGAARKNKRPKHKTYRTTRS